MALLLAITFISIFCQACVVCEEAALNDSKIIQPNHSELNNGTEPDSQEPSEELTFFERLDDAIYKSLSDPEPGRSDEIFANIEMFRDCLDRVKRMYTEMEGVKIESLRNSVVKLYVNKGGPTFTRFPINKSENKQKLMDVLKWDEETIQKIRKLQEELENAWYTVRHVVI